MKTQKGGTRQRGRPLAFLVTDWARGRGSGFGNGVDAEADDG
jgi:hypothetical protein